ncbi:MAG: tetratricopeptide repeat protein [Rikenellaceae bacterium]
MSKKIQKKQVEDPEEIIEAAIDSTEGFIKKNLKSLSIGLGAVALVACAFFAYIYLIAAPREYRASAEMFPAQQMFAADSFAMALNGTATDKGFLDIAVEYSSTAVGNVANHYAGVCYMQLGEYEKAITSLAKYKAVDGIASEIINAQNAGLQGDANVQLEKYEAAMTAFEKAAKMTENSLTTPMYYKKAGIVAEKLGKKDKALEFYTAIKNNYPMSTEGRDIDKYIGRVSF